jgi:hypothetical protein
MRPHTKHLVVILILALVSLVVAMVAARTHPWTG